MFSRRPLAVFALFAALRTFFALVTSTTHVPDETWQSVEVAHAIVFGFGYGTWEWRSGLRTYLYPLLYVPGFSMLKQLGWDEWGDLFVLLPRVLQGLISAVGDAFMHRLCVEKFGRTASNWFLLVYGSNWFVNYCSSRTVVNAMETALTSTALYFYEDKGRRYSPAVYVALIALGFVLRPTVAIFWLPLVLHHLSRMFTTDRDIGTFLFRMLPAAASVLILTTAVDSWMYGGITCVPWNFFRVNVLSDVASHYGVHPFHWYLTQGLPVVFGFVSAAPFAISCVRRSLGGGGGCGVARAVLLTIAVYSCLGHKEFRFLLPIVPIGSCFAADFLSRKATTQLSIRACALILLMINVPASMYFSVVHQSGCLSVIKHLRDTAPRGTDILILMPCHSLPHQSHLHREDVDLRFLTCEPNLAAADRYKDEADVFYDDPEKWLEAEFPEESSPPSMLVMFDVLEDRVGKFLDARGYRRCAEFFHTHIPEGRIGRTISVHCLRR